MSYAQITIVGRLGRDPEVRMTSTGKQVVSASIAVGRDEKTVWYKIQGWDKTGEFLKDAVKGDMVFAQGTLAMNTYQKKDGTTAVDPQVNAQVIRAMTQKKEATQITSSDSFEDVPF